MGSNWLTVGYSPDYCRAFSNIVSSMVRYKNWFLKEKDGLCFNRIFVCRSYIAISLYRYVALILAKHHATMMPMPRQTLNQQQDLWAWVASCIGGPLWVKSEDRKLSPESSSRNETPIPHWGRLDRWLHTRRVWESYNCEWKCQWTHVTWKACHANCHGRRPTKPTSETWTSWRNPNAQILHIALFCPLPSLRNHQRSEGLEILEEDVLQRIVIESCSGMIEG